MKKILSFLIILFSLTASAQVYQQNNLFGTSFNRGVFKSALGYPKDTIQPPSDWQSYPHIAEKNDTLYRWDIVNHYWKKLLGPIDAGRFGIEDNRLIDRLWSGGGLNSFVVDSATSAYMRTYSIENDNTSRILAADSIVEFQAGGNGVSGFIQMSPYKLYYQRNGNIGASPGYVLTLIDSATGEIDYRPTSSIRLGGINGLSDSAGYTMFGQSRDKAGNPAQLLGDREIPMNKYNVLFRNAGNVSIQRGVTGHFGLRKSMFTIALQDTTWGPNYFDDSLIAIWDKQTYIQPNGHVQFTKGVAVFTGYFRPMGPIDTVVAHGDYEHSNGAQVTGGGILLAPETRKNTTLFGPNFKSSYNTDMHKFLVQGTISGDTANLLGFAANQKIFFEASNTLGSAENYADIFVGMTSRQGVGSDYNFTNKYATYVYPVKDGVHVTNGYSMFSEGVDDSLVLLGHARVRGNLWGQSQVRAGLPHFSTSTLTAFRRDTLSGVGASGSRSAFIDKRTVYLNNSTMTSAQTSAISTTGYLTPDSSLTVTSDYQTPFLAQIVSGGILNKTGIPIQWIRGDTTADRGIGMNLYKWLVQSGDTKYINSFINNTKIISEWASAGRTSYYADLNLGSMSNAVGHLIGTKFGLFVQPIANIYVRNPYSIYQEGSADTNYLAGHTVLPNLPRSTVPGHVLAYDSATKRISGYVPISSLGGGGGGGGATYTFSAPLNESGGTVTIPNAAADGTTKGAASFTAADFNSSSGLLSIDYANGQKATASVDGYISTVAQTFAGVKTFNSIPIARGMTTASTDLIFKQTGDAYGESGLKIMNSAGAGGGKFYNTGLDLVDMAFEPNSGVFFNFRMEHRNAQFMNTNNTQGEFQFLSQSGTQVNAGWGETSNWLRGNLGIGTGTQIPNSTLNVGGSVSVSYVAKTANYTLTSTDYTVNCTTGSFTITLPTAVGATGRIYIVKNTGAGTITLATTSSQTIDGAAPTSVAAGAVAQFQSTGSNWIKIN